MIRSEAKSETTTKQTNNTANDASKTEWVPVTCVALARVRIRARFSSSDSADKTVFGSLRKRVNCGCTSELPKAVIRRRAVLSTLRDNDRKRNDDSFSLHHNPDEHFFVLNLFLS